MVLRAIRFCWFFSFVFVAGILVQHNSMPVLWSYPRHLVWFCENKEKSHFPPFLRLFLTLLVFASFFCLFLPQIHRTRLRQFSTSSSHVSLRLHVFARISSCWLTLVGSRELALARVSSLLNLVLPLLIILFHWVIQCWSSVRIYLDFFLKSWCASIWLFFSRIFHGQIQNIINLAATISHTQSEWCRSYSIVW